MLDPAPKEPENAKGPEGGLDLPDDDDPETRRNRQLDEWDEWERSGEWPW